ncbi:MULTISPECIES: COX15/CtaA family protein [unclassified Janibacter]|uniref:COX15/CtaA family protein n=1 Tax=unclassified Janibacter TaxID=2649294 RepID=UPI003D06F066
MTAPHASAPSRRSPFLAPSPWLHRILLTNVVVEVLIVVTGGLVRLTGSGLGCPTWPQCVPGSYVPVREQAEGFHSLIEYGNRTLTGLVGIVALAALVAVLMWTDRRRSLLVPAGLVLGGVALQALIGGITVLTHLHPATVATHFMVSSGLVAAATYLWLHAKEAGAPPRPLVPAPVLTVARVTAALTALVLVLGTVVTGSGPHSGDAEDPARFGFDPRTISWLHADAVMLLVGLVVAVWLATRLTATDTRAHRGWTIVLGITLAQGLIGYVQYLTDLPEVLVMAHMLGASLLVMAVVNGLMALRDRG